MKLTSVKMQTVIFSGNFEKEYYMPILRFGKGKKNMRKMPLFFKSSKKASEFYDEIIQLKGKSIEEMRLAHDSLIKKYNKFSAKQ